MIEYQGKNVKAKPGVYKMLSESDIIQAGDLCRCLTWPTSDEDDILKRLNWAKVDNQMPFWIGKTLSGFHEDPLVDRREIIRLIND